MQLLIYLVGFFLVALVPSPSEGGNACEDLDLKDRAKSTASIYIPCIAEQAKEIAKLKTQVSKLERVNEPLDDYILKVFLMEIAKDKGQPSEYAARISQLINQGQIRAAFKIFSDSIGQEIDMLAQIKIGYQRPTTVQVDYALFRTFQPKPKSKPTDFGVLVNRGQKLELKATLLKYNTVQREGVSPETPLDFDPGFPAVDLTIRCTGCKRRDIQVPSVKSASDFGTKDLTEEIDWETGDSAVTKLKFVELQVAPTPPADTDYEFSGKFVVLVTNPIPQPKTP
jgi:hypothetical protein